MNTSQQFLTALATSLIAALPGTGTGSTAPLEIEARSFQGTQAQERGASEAAAPGAPFVIERPSTTQALAIPRAEILRYKAEVRTALIDANVGTVELSSGIERRRPSLLGARRGETGAEIAWVKAHAYGDYSLYVMDATIHTRFQPDAWPRMIHSYRHEGTEKRRRELLAGVKGGEWTANYRSDTKNGAPQGTRIWRPAAEGAVPADPVDTLGAVYLVRTAMAAGSTELSFFMLDKLRIWKVDVQFGEPEEVETGAGTYLARRVDLLTERVDEKAAEDAAAEAAEREAEGVDEEFEGPFGLRGNIVLWMEAQTGIPVVISGTMPMLLGEIEVDIRLDSAENTPPEFVPLAGGEEG